MTLKRLGDSQQAMETSIAKDAGRFARLSKDIQSGKLKAGVTAGSVRKTYGEPVLTKQLQNPAGATRWLYRHPTHYFTSEKVYLYFDESEVLTSWYSGADL